MDAYFRWCEDLGRRFTAMQHRLSIEQYENYRDDREQVVLPGLRIRPYRQIHLEVKSTGMRMLPRAALNMGVTITPSANTASTYGPNAQAL
jgi:hypothetical protein